MGEDVNLQIFNKKIKETEKLIMDWVQKEVIDRLVQRGKEAYREYLMNEERLRNETFSRS